MNAHNRAFEDKPAVREQVPLLIGLMGPSGSGKTFSALRLATGIQAVSGGDIYVIDTEARRSLHYADQFKFRHVEFGAPFGSLDYLAALKHCVAKGAKVIVVDSMTHEHSGPGGYLLTQDAELDRMAGTDWQKRERVKMAAWIKPAGLRQQMITGILQLNANFIFCFRAKEKSKPAKKADGKTEIVELGFMPIAGEELLFEMTVNCLLLPKAGGVPAWRSDHVGERMMMKLPKQFEGVFGEAKPLDEDTGRRLAEWAKGVTVAAAAPAKAAQPDQPAGDADDLAAYESYVADRIADEDETAASLGKWWNSPTQKEQRRRLGAFPERIATLKADVTAAIAKLKAAETEIVDESEPAEAQ